MSEEILTMVKIPLSQIEHQVRSKHSLPETLIDVRLEADSLVLYFAEKPKIQPLHTLTPVASVSQIKRRRRARRKRNRMKTRGWEVLDRIVNSKGQKCAIYKPFVDALRQPMEAGDQRVTVAKILKSNDNRPTETSISYFLENTLEYLKMQSKPPSV